MSPATHNVGIDIYFFCGADAFNDGANLDFT